MTSPVDLRYLSLLVATPDRAAEIAAIHARLFDPSWDEASVTSLLEHPASAAYLAMLGQPKHTVGFVMSQIAGDEAEILSIGVSPEYQRSGLGRSMLEGLIRSLRRAEITKLFLEVAADNIPALVLYKKMGFDEIGRRKGYYQRAGAPAEDALNLALEI